MPIVYAIISSLLISLFFVLTKSSLKYAQHTVISSLVLSASTVTLWAFAIIKYGSPFSGVKGSWVLPAVVTGVAVGLAVVFLCSALKNSLSVASESVLYLIPVFLILFKLISKNKQLNYYAVIFIVLTVAGISVISFGKKAKSLIWFFSALLSTILLTFTVQYKTPETKNELCFICLSSAFSLLTALIVMFVFAIIGKTSRIKASGVFEAIIAGVLPGLAYFMYSFADRSDICTLALRLNIPITAILSLIFTRNKFSWKTACGLLLLITGSVVYTFCPI